jgi:hypothetical protein
LVGEPERKRHSEDPGVNGRIVLKQILGKEDWKPLLGVIWFRIGKSGGILLIR